MGEVVVHRNLPPSPIKSASRPPHGIRLEDTPRDSRPIPNPQVGIQLPRGHPDTRLLGSKGLTSDRAQGLVHNRYG